MEKRARLRTRMFAAQTAKIRRPRAPGALFASSPGSQKKNRGLSFPPQLRARSPPCKSEGPFGNLGRKRHAHVCGPNCAQGPFLQVLLRAKKIGASVFPPNFALAARRESLRGPLATSGEKASLSQWKKARLRAHMFAAQTAKIRRPRAPFCKFS